MRILRNLSFWGQEFGMNKHRKKIGLYLSLIILLFQLCNVLIFYVHPYFIPTDDGVGYIGYLENLFKFGTYEYNKITSGRMPGFLPIYVPIRFIFPQQSTIILMGFLQLTFYSIAVTYFAYQTAYFFKKSTLFMILLALILGLTDSITAWCLCCYTETLAVSALLMGFSFLFQGISKKKPWFLFYSGVFFSWTIFLRPFMILIFLIIGLYLFFSNRVSFQARIKYLVLFILSFIVFDGGWIFRNYLHEQKIIPLQSTIMAGSELTNTTNSFRLFISSFGGDAVHWNPGSAGMWFQKDEYLQKFKFKRPGNDVFPSIIFSESFNIDSLKQLRVHYWAATDINLHKDERDYHASLFTMKVNTFISDFKHRAPFFYYIGSRLILLKKFLFYSYTYYLPSINKINDIQWLMKIFLYILNALIIIGGHACIFIYSIKCILGKVNRIHFILIITPIYIILLFPLLLKFIEYRFLIMSFPFIAFYLIWVVDFIFKRLLINKTLVTVKTTPKGISR